MKNAFSMSLNRLFTADYYAINYQSYDLLYLTCDVCGESVFFKQGSDFNKPGIKRAAHFSHYKDTGKNNCILRTESNTNLQYIDTEGKKQSLENFHIKIQKIIDGGIIKFKNIKLSELSPIQV